MRSIRRTTTALSVAVVAIASGTLAAPSASASTHHQQTLGTRSLASVLALDGASFDHNWHDFDIVDAAVNAVLKAKPSSPVAVLADGTVPLTALLPTDRAFRVLVKDLTGHWYGSESEVFAATTSLGIDTVETVLLHHVVPGRPSPAGRRCAPTARCFRRPCRTGRSPSTSSPGGSQS